MPTQEPIEWVVVEVAGRVPGSEVEYVAVRKSHWERHKRNHPANAARLVTEEPVAREVAVKMAVLANGS